MISRTYTAVNFISAAFLIGLVLMIKPELLRRFFPGYLVILIPFGLVNGVLTGSFIEEQIVWYNDQENLGIRLGTIPIEDVILWNDPDFAELFPDGNLSRSPYR